MTFERAHVLVKKNITTLQNRGHILLIKIEKKTETDFFLLFLASNIYEKESHFPI